MQVLRTLKERFWTNSVTFKALRTLPLQLWLLFVIHLGNSFGSFAYSPNLTIYMKRVFSVATDLETTRYYAIWSLASIVVGIPGGMLIEVIGLWWSIFIGSAILTVSRILFAFSSNLILTLVTLFVGISIGSDILESALDIAVSYYTESDAVQTIVFNILYATMNIGAVLAFNLTDILLDACVGWNGYRLLFTVAAAVSIICSLLAYNYKVPRLFKTAAKEAPKFKLSMMVSLFKEYQFWQIFGLNLLLSGVKMIFRFIETMLVVYLVRTNDNVRYGMLLSINPILIIPSVSIAAVITQRWLSVFWWIVVGSLISATSISWLWLWPGSTIVAGILCQIQMTIGEAIWGPKVKQYQVVRAPQGKKAIYAGWLPISHVPATLISGELAGYLLDTHCPDLELDLLGSASLTEHRGQCRMMWGWVFFLALSSPVLISACAWLINWVPRKVPKIEDEQKPVEQLLDVAQPEEQKAIQQPEKEDENMTYQEAANKGLRSVFLKFLTRQVAKKDDGEEERFQPPPQDFEMEDMKKSGEEDKQSLL
jgi:MFS family permease